ncbi:alginate O-acetyltransferase complex protein AlgI [Hymenobacter gelipurpurascens]|uniref:Alginate O-acetyltransferase complex protein AlgI n=1 Tax=Hymenobacter gelipurpurascens TaxID=89968 RepID=A0A212UG40_9BACT|nr:MBOAT family protein [Hymenobacter gelipurpurascens]SNC77232.1 alginate O-acetyltransferase complex protein AlgI [Hymenobacter gelipurpurascens]
MVFSSTLFLFYFLPGFLLLYFLAPTRLKNAVALIGSLLFYAWGGLNFLALFLGSVVLNFYLIRLMDAAMGWQKRIYLTSSILLNVGMLFYFKYANFFLGNLSEVKTALGGEALHWQQVVLPIGISFFTFEKLTYSIDVYRGVNRPLRSFWDFLLYIMLFPKMIAGPIVRFHEIAEQLQDRSAFDTVDQKLAGLFRFVIGLAKKVLIANALGQEADRIFQLNPAELSAPLAWLGAVAYTFQIYFDFSGYSDMAIGIGRMLGFQFPENFNNPYISRSITEFWQRWHITLGRWMRDYLYIPLGGNRVKPARLYLNLWTVFLLSGFWHGAAWNFVAWGAFHGLFLILDRLFQLRLSRLLGPLSIVPTFLITVVGWVLFRAESLSAALAYLGTMFRLDWPSHSLVGLSPEFWTTLGLAATLSFMAALPRVERWELGWLTAEPMPLRRAIGLGLLTVVLFLLSASYVVSSTFNPFIYFRF